MSEEYKALAFARQHDWGVDAKLDRTNGQLYDLWEVSVDPAGNVETGKKTCPATVRGVRDFGGY